MTPGVKQLSNAILIYQNFLDGLKSFCENDLSTAKANQVKLRRDDLLRRHNDFIKDQTALENLDEEELKSNTRTVVDNIYYLVRPALEDRLEELKDEKRKTSPNLRQ